MPIHGQQSNLIQNSKLDYNSTSGLWAYAPIRYWPVNADEYLSFMAYSPYDANSGLYTKETDGMKQDEENVYNGSYIRLTVPSDKSRMTDYLYNDAAQTTNMQCYYEDNATTISTKVNDIDNTTAFTTPTGESVPRVLLNMKHATARIAIDISCSALADPVSDYYTDKTT